MQILFLLLLLSCHRDIINPVQTGQPSTFNEVFENFWIQMNTNYLYWSKDSTNWDKIYQKYKPVFQNLDINNNEDLKKSLNLFRQMTSSLIDGHYSISFTIPKLKDSFLFPALDQKKNTSNFHGPFDYSSIDSNYLDKGFVNGYYLNNNRQHVFAMSGTINNKILYFSCNLFSLQEAYLSSSNNGVKKVLLYFFGQIKNLPSSITGIIIDVRNNYGGDVSDLNFFIGQLINKPLKFGYTRYKSGNGRLDYTSWVDATVIPNSTNKVIKIPIEVLADNYSFSMAEAVTMALKVIPNTIFIGEHTWGATGPITNNFIYNDGSFDVKNFMTIVTSSAEFKYIDNKSYENIGFPPDSYIPFNIFSLTFGDDLILDKAISLIH